MISMFVKSDHRDWDAHLHEFRHAINTAKQASTHVSPAYLNYGRHPRQVKSLRREIEKHTSICKLDPEIWVDRMKRLDALRDLALKYTDEARAVQTRQYNKGRKNPEFNVGDLVLRRTHVLSNAARKFSAKLAPKYDGPFQIIEVLSPVVYVLETDSKKRNAKVHVSDLKRYLKPRITTGDSVHAARHARGREQSPSVDTVTNTHMLFQRTCTMSELPAACSEALDEVRALLEAYVGDKLRIGDFASGLRAVSSICPAATEETTRKIPAESERDPLPPPRGDASPEPRAGGSGSNPADAAGSMAAPPTPLRRPRSREGTPAPNRDETTNSAGIGNESRASTDDAAVEDTTATEAATPEAETSPQPSTSASPADNLTVLTYPQLLGHLQRLEKARREQPGSPTSRSILKRLGPKPAGDRKRTPPASPATPVRTEVSGKRRIRFAAKENSEVAPPPPNRWLPVESGASASTSWDDEPDVKDFSNVYMRSASGKKRRRYNPQRDLQLEDYEPLHLHRREESPPLQPVRHAAPLPRRIGGVMFLGAANIPRNPVIDPPAYHCFNCWQTGHNRTACPRPRVGTYCWNCGRRGVELANCPRCGVAYEEYLRQGRGAREEAQQRADNGALPALMAAPIPRPDPEPVAREVERREDRLPPTLEMLRLSGRFTAEMQSEVVRSFLDDKRPPPQ